MSFYSSRRRDERIRSFFERLSTTSKNRQENLEEVENDGDVGLNA